MPDSTVSKLPEIEASLAFSKTKKLAVLREEIPAWPEKASLLMCLFFTFFLNNPISSTEFGKIMLTTLFMGAVALQWFSIRKLRLRLALLIATFIEEQT